MAENEGASLTSGLIKMIDYACVGKYGTEGFRFDFPNSRAERLYNKVEEAWILVESMGKDAVYQRLVRGIENLQISDYDDIRNLKPEFIADAFYRAAMTDKREAKSEALSDENIVKKVSNYVPTKGKCKNVNLRI